MDYGIWFLFCVSLVGRHRRGFLGLGAWLTCGNWQNFLWQAETGGILDWRAQTLS